MKGVLFYFGSNIFFGLMFVCYLCIIKYFKIMNIIDLIKSQINPQVISQVSNQLAENESGVSNAIDGFLPLIVGGLADNAEKPSVLDAITGISSNGFSVESLGSLMASPAIGSVIFSIFGDKTEGVINSISNFAGIQSTSSSALLNILTGTTLGVVGKYVADNNLDVSGIISLLNNQKSFVSSLIPAGLSLAGLGLGNLHTEEKVVETPKVQVSPTTTTTEAPKVQVTRAEKKEEKGSIFKWLLPLLLLGLAAFFVWKQCNKNPNNEGVNTNVDSTSVDSTTMANDSTQAVVAPTRVEKELTLPLGTKIKAYQGGIEDQIVTFLQSDEYKNATSEQLKDKWFNFDNLNFEFGTTTITKESQVQLDNLKAILKEFPEAKIKIGAYTDKVGDDNANLKLSQQRADAVKNAIASAQIIGAEGYGEKFATIDEKASDKEREADRKTAIRFEK